MRLYNVELDGIRNWDCPDYADAFICYAEHVDGTPLTRDELNGLDSEVVYEHIIEYLY